MLQHISSASRIRLICALAACVVLVQIRAFAADSPPPLDLGTAPSKLRFLAAADFKSGKLRGFQLGDASHSDQPKENYFSDLAATGANLGRLFIVIRRCKDCTDYKMDDMQLRNIDYFVSHARQYGFWVVLCLSTYDERAGELWRNEALQRGLAANWKAIASRYKDVPEIAGYELINEPIVTWEDKPASKLIWFKVATDVTAAIRSIDQRHVVIVEPTPGAETTAFSYGDPIKDSNLVYSLHMYHPFPFTHQGIGKDFPRRDVEYPIPAGSPMGAWDKNRLSQDLDPVRKFSQRTGIPIYVSEFSAVRWAPSGSRDRYVSDLVSLFEAEHWAWTYLAWRSWPGWDPENDSTQQDIMAHERNPKSSTMQLLTRYFSMNGR